MAHTTSRYSGSTVTRLEADLKLISDLDESEGEEFCERLDKEVSAAFRSDYWTISLPSILDNAYAKSPALLAYWAALNLLNAEVLFGSQLVWELFDLGEASKRSIERHHLFPKAHLASKGIVEKRHVNAIANMGFVDWPDNAAIGAKDPREYWPALSARMNPEQRRRQMYWHALPPGWEQLDYADFLEKRRKLIAKVIKDGFEALRDESSPSSNLLLDDLLSRGESQLVEFKSTVRFNAHIGGVDKRLEHVIVKSVCGFLNADGGTLLIGVDDDGRVLGLEEDMRTMSRPGRDTYELHLRQLLDANLSTPTAGLVSIRFEGGEPREVCLVSVSPSAKPVFAKPEQGRGQAPSEFWVRIGNATKQLAGQKMMDYQQRHWD